MQGWRQPQPSRTNRPSSSGTAPRGPRDPALARSGHEDAPESCFPMRHAAPRARERHRTPRTVGAAHRSAAIAWGARPVPFRTRKLSPIAPRVLRGQPVGGQGAADRWTAPGRRMTLRRGRPRGLPLFCVIQTDIYTICFRGVRISFSRGHRCRPRRGRADLFAYVAFWWRSVGSRVLSSRISGRILCSLFQ